MAVLRLSGLVVCLFLLPSSAFATWSVVAVDRNSGRVVIASATCLALEEPQSLRQVQAVIVPGVGIAACQALIDGSGRNQKLVYDELRKGTDPKEIIRLLKGDGSIEQRQYGIVDLNGHAVGYTGAGTLGVSLDRQGQVPGTGIYYSIQGNILRDERVISEAVKAFVNTNGALTDRVMAALETGDHLGGDRRCDCTTTPTAKAPCEGKSSHVAYILMAEKGDASDSYNTGQYALYLSVTQGNVRPDENANPVKTLRLRYDAWRKKQPQSYR